ncbi:MAG: hypothetical protein ABI725_06530 [Chloroflexota bacterium]
MKPFDSLRARLATCAALSVFLLSTVVAPVAAASRTRWVDNNTSSQGPAACASAHFSTIQAAIDASSAWDKVYVCPGKYQEQLTIDVAGLEVRAIPALGARLWAPATIVRDGLVSSLVHITKRNVTFAGFRVKIQAGEVVDGVHGVTTACDGPIEVAIWAQAAHAVIKANHVEAVGDATLSGDCGYYFGIALAEPAYSTGGTWGPDTSLVWRNWVKDPKIGGILTGGDRSVKVWNNNIRYVHYKDPATCELIPVLGVRPLEGIPSGFGCELPLNLQAADPFDGISPYSQGIVDEGALVDLRGNTVYSTIDTAVSGNQQSFLGVGIGLWQATDGSRVRSNIVDNVGYGILVTDEPGVFTNPALNVPAAPDGVAVSGNRVSESFFGFFVVDGTDSYYYANRAHLNIVGALVVNDFSGSSDNTFERNDFRYNAEGDCIDETSGGYTYATANDWGDPTTNLGFSDDPDGICVPFFPILP